VLAVPSKGVPEIHPAIELNVNPLGRVPDKVRVGAGKPPVEVITNVPPVPTSKVMFVPLIMHPVTQYPEMLPGALGD
jgi:hypothetical protein